MHTRRFLTGLATVILLAGGATTSFAAVGGPGSGGTTFSTTSSFSQTLHTTSVDQEVDTFLTRVLGRIQLGDTVYDMSFALPYGDASVQAALQQAQADLLAFAGTPLDFSGPSLISDTRTLTNTSTNTVRDSIVTTVGSSITNTIGPELITIGDLGTFDNPCAGYTGGGEIVPGGLSGFPNADFHFSTAVTPVGCPLPGTAFTVAAGNVNIDAAFHTQSDIYQTTTTTRSYLVSQIYELVGRAQGGEPISVPESSGLALFGGGLIALALLRRRQRRVTVAHGVTRS